MEGTDRNQRGASAVEFAIIAPLFISLLFAIVEFGLIIYTKGIMTHASREGARFGVVYAIPRRTPAEIEARVREYLNLSGLTSPATVNVSGAGGASGTPLDVTVDYTYRFFVVPNIINNYFGGSLGNVNLKATAVMSME